MKKISGEIEMSKPPPMIAGALASAAIASGATSASWFGQAEAAVLGGSMFATAARRREDSAKREAVGALPIARRASRRGALRGRPRRAALRRLAPSRGQPSPSSPKNAATSVSRGQLAAVELAEQLVLAEHEHAVHQLDVLVELGRQHHDREPLARERAEQRVEVVLGADVDAARRVVEQQDLGPEREPAGDHDLLLVAAATAS